MEKIPKLAMLKGPTIGNAIIVGISCISTFGQAPQDAGGQCTIMDGGLTDNYGNAYARVHESGPILSSQQGARAYLFIAPTISSTGVDFTLSVEPVGATEPSETQAIVWGAIEVAGLAPLSLDAKGAGLSGSNDAFTAVETALPTVQTNELAVAVLTIRSTDTNMLIKPEPAWSLHHVYQNGATGLLGHSMVSKTLSSVGIATHTWTHDIPDRGTAAIIATFKGQASSTLPATR